VPGDPGTGAPSPRYETALQKFSDDESLDPAVLSGSAQIVRQFVERYHERNEELHVFPRFRTAGQDFGPTATVSTESASMSGSGGSVAILQRAIPIGFISAAEPRAGRPRRT
jgi:hypothetical protein